MADELSAPLGRKKKRKDRPKGETRFRPGALPIARILFGLIGLILIVVIGRIILVDDPEGGRPVAEMSISSARATNEVAADVVTEPIQGVIPGPADPGSETAPTDGSIIVIDDALPEFSNDPELGIAALTEFGVDPDLIEETQNGPIPRVSTEGRTPFETYARAGMTPASANGKALIAIVVTGLGLSEAGTLEAIEKLPDNVTLAFAPYGRSLQRTAGAARAGGHELLLEVPLEPFDYPDNDPGPQTLLTGQPPRANLDRLFWLLARLGGYTGLINHMGARFTASAADFTPIMEELGTRGLGFVDDGSSNRSLAANLAQNNRVPFARGNAQIDLNPSRAAIMAELEALEVRAAQNGSAIGIASALPVSIQTIADWSRTLDDESILLVPISALMTKP